MKFIALEGVDFFLKGSILTIKIFWENCYNFYNFTMTKQILKSGSEVLGYFSLPETSKAPAKGAPVLIRHLFYVPLPVSTQ